MKKYFAVIDTNVLVSALLRWESLPGRVVIEVLAGQIVPLLNHEILSEYREVLARPKFRFNAGETKTVLDGIIKRGIFVCAEKFDEAVSDPDDAVFYAVTMETRKDEEAYLVTGNTKHFPAQPFVVTPREMMEIINAESEN